MSEDWTVDTRTGKSNSSPTFLMLVDEVTRLIKDDAHYLISTGPQGTARLIMAQLAHVHGLQPKDVP